MCPAFPPSLIYLVFKKFCFVKYYLEVMLGMVLLFFCVLLFSLHYYFSWFQEIVIGFVLEI